MRLAVNTGARCKYQAVMLILSMSVSALLTSACRADADEGNPFLRPYVRPPADMGPEEPGQQPDASTPDPFEQGRMPCERDATSCALPGATGICVEGVCRLVACLEGQGDCDDDPNNGCEVDFTSLQTCGSCASVCADNQSCQKSSTGYTCAVGVLCPEGSLDLDDDSSNGCEWSQGVMTGQLQPEGRFGVIQRVALLDEEITSDSRSGAVTGFDGEGRRAVLLSGSGDAELQVIAELDEPFTGESRALDVQPIEGGVRAFDVWGDAAYLHESTQSEFSTIEFSLMCAATAEGMEVTTQLLRGGALARRWDAELIAEHMFLPLDVCELPDPQDESTLIRQLCVDRTRAFGPADYLRWFYPYEDDTTLENPGAHAPASARLSEEEVARCTQCALDLSTGSFAAPRACYAEQHCDVGPDAVVCEPECTQPATACPDFEVMDVFHSPISDRHYVVTRRGVVVLRDDGQVWVPLARLEEPWSASVISGSSFVRVASVRSGDTERLFLLHNRGFVRVLDVSLSEPVTLLPAHPDIPLDLGDLDNRGPMAFVAADANTLLFSDPYEGRVIHLNGLDHKRAALTFEQDVPGNGFFGAHAQGSSFVVYRIEFGVLSALVLSR